MSSSAQVSMGDHVPGTIYPFHSNGSSINILLKEIVKLMYESEAKRIMGYIVLSLVSAIVLLFWCSSTNSMALTAYTYMMIFNILSLMSCLVTIWVQNQKPSPIFSFGYERFEVLSVFSSTILATLGCFFILKESVERMFQQPDIHTGRLLFGTLLAFTCNMIVTYSIDNRAFSHVISASSSSWLQEHVSDISESICQVIPGLSKLLLPRLNPLSLINTAGALALLLAYVLIDISQYHAADTWVAVWIALMIMGTMFPMSIYSGKILLQSSESDIYRRQFLSTKLDPHATTPSHIIGQLDKCIREASTLDGVLEFRHEHFWTLSFATMAGSVHVRIRRDADEQLVLSHVYNRLSNLVSLLTVHIFKDDWNRPSAYQILGDSSLFSSHPAVPNLPSNRPAIPNIPDKNTQAGVTPSIPPAALPPSVGQLGRIGASAAVGGSYAARPGADHNYSTVRTTNQSVLRDTS